MCQERTSALSLKSVELAAGQYRECLNQIFGTDLESKTQEDVAIMLEILNITGDINQQVRKKLESYQLPSAANEIASGQIEYCPQCAQELVFGLKSCFLCGWNMGLILPSATLPPEDSSTSDAFWAYMDP
jgi:hypothetical protein